MSYDLYFLAREPGQSWDEALAAAEESDAETLPGDLLAAWERIVPEAQEILGTLDEQVDDDLLQLTAPDSGLQLTIVPGEVTITVPDDEPGAELMAEVYDLAELVERETGREGYDPQLDKSVSDARGKD